MHGGKPKDFEELTTEDIQILYTTYMSLRAGAITDLLKGIYELFRGE